MADRFGKLRFEQLEDRRVLSAAPLLDLNGAAPSADFVVDRVDNMGLVALVAHQMTVADADSPQLASATVTINSPKTGDVLGALTHDTNIDASFTGGVLQLSGNDTLEHYRQVLSTVRFNSTATRAVGDQIDVSFVVSDGTNLSATAHSIVRVIEPGETTIAGRRIFYNNSIFDGNDPAANDGDDLATAFDKGVLLQGQTASRSNVSSYQRGINGISIDLDGAHGAITAEDFIFQVGNNNHPDTWFNAPEPTSIVVRPHKGLNGTDRVEIIWADGAIANEWLQVVVAANSRTGLPTPDSFLFGSSVGDSGNTFLDARVNSIDVLHVLNRLWRYTGDPSSLENRPLDDLLDLNRDGTISSKDLLLVLNRIQAAGPEVNLISVDPIAPDQINTTTSTGAITTGIGHYGPSPVSFPSILVDGHYLSQEINVRPTSLKLFFSFALTVLAGTTGAHSASNPANYQLFKDDVELSGAITSASVVTTVPPDIYFPASPYSTVILTFDHALTPGYYKLVIRGTIYDVNFKPLDWQGDGVLRRDVSRTFFVSTIQRSNTDASPVSVLANYNQGTVASPAVVATPGGDFITAWTKRENADKTDLFIQRLNVDHQPVGTPQVVSTNFDTADVSLAIDGAGVLTVVWSGASKHTAGSNPGDLVETNHVFARRYAANLTPLANTWRVDPSDPGGADLTRAGRADVAANAAGDLIISWLARDKSNHLQAVARLYDATGQARGGVITLVDGPDEDVRPQIAIDGAGKFVVVWTAAGVTTSRLVGRQFEANGQPHGTEFTIQEVATGSSVSSPAVAVSASGDFVVAWSQLDGTHAQIRARRYFANASPPSDVIEIDSRLSGWVLDHPQLSYDAQGGFVISWQVVLPAQYSSPTWVQVEAKGVYFARRYDALGRTFAPATLISTDEFIPLPEIYNYQGPYVAAIALATDAQGRTMVVSTVGYADAYRKNGTQFALMAQTWRL